MKLTPSEIVNGKHFYTIPIYQRLFEWATDNVITLLDDLRGKFISSNGQDDYFIGMLTSTDNNELIDGQQRFTVMMLMGCVFQKYHNGWKEFLKANDKIRLFFTSRPLDNEYMRGLIEQMASADLNITNDKMKDAIKCIQEYMEKNVDEAKEFVTYVFNHLCFFITTLPKGYSPRDLNRYFERMNTTGRNLEQHETLKVKLLSNLAQDVDKYISLWNKLSDVDTLLIKKRENESEEQLRQRKNQAFQKKIDEILVSDIINGLGVSKDEKKETIGSVKASNERPKREQEINKDSRCALTFPYLLLHALYCFLEGDIKDSIEDFFKPSNFLDTFAKYLPYDADANEDNIKSFLNILYKARLALDICFIRPTEFGYILDMGVSEDVNGLKDLMMYQSLLYVSSSNYTNYRWFGWLIDAIEKAKNKIPDALELFRDMKSRDEELRKLPKLEDLSYGNDIRYWFWKLDFLIWQKREELFKKDSDALAVAENYVFRRNRSIEHIAPQTPETDSTMVWEGTDEDRALRDSFGNLVMISQGLNSALRNSSYEIKKAHAQSYYNSAKSGSIESLKLLLVHQEYPTKWDKEDIKEHGEEMYKLLRESFESK